MQYSDIGKDLTEVLCQIRCQLGSTLLTGHTRVTKTKESRIKSKFVRKVDTIRPCSWRSVCSVTLMCDMPPCYRSRDTNAVTQIFQTRVSHYSNYCQPDKHRQHFFKGKVSVFQLSLFQGSLISGGVSDPRQKTSFKHSNYPMVKKTRYWWIQGLAMDIL